jgi:hypothetical protein
MYLIITVDADVFARDIIIAIVPVSDVDVAIRVDLDASAVWFVSFFGPLS